jgi:predicted DNA-binding protein YlxM (UPF0122 family)
LLEKTEHMIWLLDFYQAVLTEKQREVLKLYYEDDLTLTEIAEQMAISRQAVHDLVSRSGAVLQQWEDKLGLVGHFQLHRAKLLHLRKLVENLDPGVGRQALLAAVDDMAQWI